jgi:hypothetical protein
MENEDLLTLLVNYEAEKVKQLARMRAKYVFTDRSGTVQEQFDADAKIWAQWAKIGVK